MTNKLVVIINSLKLPIIKNILLYEMKFLVPNYSYRLQIPVLRSQLNLLKPPPLLNIIPGYATAVHNCSLGGCKQLNIFLANPFRLLNFDSLNYPKNSTSFMDTKFCFNSVSLCKTISSSWKLSVALTTDSGGSAWMAFCAVLNSSKMWRNS